MLKISYAGCSALSPAIMVQFTLKVCVATRNCKKFTKPFILGVQGRSRSSMLIALKRPSPVFAMISSMYRFYARRANGGKMRTFKRGTPLWCHRSRGTHAHRGTKFCHETLESLSNQPRCVFRETVFLFETRCTPLLLCLQNYRVVQKNGIKFMAQ